MFCHRAHSDPTANRPSKREGGDRAPVKMPRVDLMAKSPAELPAEQTKKFLTSVRWGRTRSRTQGPRGGISEKGKD